MRAQGRTLWLLCATASTLLSLLATTTCGELYVGTDIDVIRKRAVSLYGTVDAIDGEQVVFPDLMFDCPGNITSIWFVARENGNGNVYPEFQVWNGTVTGSGDTATFQGTVQDSRAASGASRIMGDADMALYQLTLSEPLQFAAGDVFGINHSVSSDLVVQYQDGGGVQTWRFDSGTFEQDSTYRYPLVSLGDLHCGNGFLSLRALQLHLNASNSSHQGTVSDIPRPPANQHDSIFLFHSLKFTQNGVLDKWVFAATRTLTFPGFQVFFSEFQVWRGGRENRTMVSQHIITSAASRTGYLNVYEVTLDSPQRAQAGDYIGILIPTEAVGPISVVPQWIEGMGPQYPQYDKLVESLITGQPPFYDSSGQAIPLFAAILQDPSPSLTPSIVNQIPNSLHPTATVSCALPMCPPVSTRASSATVTDQPVVSKGETPANQDESSIVGAVIGALVGILLVSIVIAALVILLLIVLRRRYSHKREETLSKGNPIYTEPEFQDVTVQTSPNVAYACPTAPSEVPSHGYLIRINEAYECPSTPAAVANDNHNMATSQNEACAYQDTPNAEYRATAADDDGGYVVNQLVYDVVKSPHS